MRRPRPFGTLDVVILLAFGAGAVAAAVWREVQFVRHASQYPDRRTYLDAKQVARRPPWLWSLDLPVRRVTNDLEAFLVVATVGLGTAALRRPSLLRGRDWPGPGIVVGVVGAIAVVYSLAHLLAMVNSGVAWAPQIRRRFFENFNDVSAQAVEGMILGSWTLLAVARRWRPRPDDWDDRLGRVLGWSWLALYGYRILYPAIWT